MPTNRYGNPRAVHLVHARNGVKIWVPIEFTERGKLIGSQVLVKRTVRIVDGRYYIWLFHRDMECVLFPDYWHVVDTVTEPSEVAALLRLKPPKE